MSSASSGGEARARRRTPKRHSFRWRERETGVHRRASFATARARDAFAREVTDARAGGRDWKPARDAEGGPGLAQMMAAYIQHSARTRSDRTARDRREKLGLFLAWVVRRFGRGDVGADVLSRSLCEDYDHHLATKGHRTTYGVQSRRITHSVIFGFWRWCADREEWDRLVPMPRRIELPDPVLASVHAPTWSDADTMIAHVEEEAHRRAAVLMRMLGLRVGQVCRLLWSDFDFMRGELTIRGELGKTRREKVGRVLPLPPALRDELETWGRRDGLLIRRSVSSVQRAMRAAWAASGLPPVFWQKRPLHALRKAFRSELRAAHVPSDAIEYWCGRRTGGQTDDYTDPRSLALRQIADGIAPLAPRAQGPSLLRLMRGPAAEAA